MDGSFDCGRFLDAWRAGDYPSAFDNLHRYFDYTMHNRDRSFYQYALLNLAILQADFGSHSEAVSAMQEAIAIARESHDMHCLNFCMSWMYHFGKAFPEETKDVQNTGMLGSEKDGLAFLKAKAKETEMWGLFSTTQLSEAKLELQNVGPPVLLYLVAMLTDNRERAWHPSLKTSPRRPI